MIKIGVVGCTGNLGKTVVQNILNDRELELSSVVGRKGNQLIGKDISEITG